MVWGVNLSVEGEKSAHPILCDDIRKGFLEEGLAKSASSARSVARPMVTGSWMGLVRKQWLVSRLLFPRLTATQWGQTSLSSLLKNSKQAFIFLQCWGWNPGLCTC